MKTSAEKGLASITAHTKNMIKMCYSRIINTANKDNTTGQLM